jgi:drug/metabolite transporter (DMT)-like permease
MILRRNKLTRSLMHSAFIKLTPAVFVGLWATGFIGAKYGLPDAPPLTFLLLRVGIVIALMTIIAVATRAPWPRGFQIVHVAVAGVLLQAGYLGGVFCAIDFGMSAGLAALIVGLQPVLTAGLASAMGEHVSARQWAGLALGFGGVALVVWNKAGGAGADWAAYACAVTALVSITTGTIYQKRFCGAQDLRTQSVVQFVAAGAVFLPLALLIETRPVMWSLQLIFALGWLVIVLSLGATSLLLLLIRRGAATQVSSLMYLVPPVTALMAWILFGEVLAPLALGGTLLAVAGVALVVRPAPPVRHLSLPPK